MRDQAKVLGMAVGGTLLFFGVLSFAGSLLRSGRAMQQTAAVQATPAAATQAAAPEIALIWRQRGEGFLWGTCRNIGTRPLYMVHVSVPVEVYDEQSGFEAGSHVEYPPAVVEPCDLAPGQRATVSVWNVTPGAVYRTPEVSASPEAGGAWAPVEFTSKVVPD